MSVFVSIFTSFLSLLISKFNCFFPKSPPPTFALSSNDHPFSSLLFLHRRLSWLGHRTYFRSLHRHSMHNAMRSFFGTYASGSVVLSTLVFLVILFGIPSGRCQTGDEIDDGGMNQIFARPFYNKLQTLTGTYSEQIGDKLDYCIKDRWSFNSQLYFLMLLLFCWYTDMPCDFCRDADWNNAFNFSSNLTFMTECFKETSMLPIYFFFKLLVFRIY